jgi:hypothetical protein
MNALPKYVVSRTLGDELTWNTGVQACVYRPVAEG